MARYYSYGRRRYGRRYYRRGYRRYGGTSLRRYRSVQMNDNETKVMAFSSIRDTTISLSEGAGTYVYTPVMLLSGISTAVVPASGRPFFAGMMFDRLRFRSVSVTLRPKVMPSSTATNYIVYAAWDRYSSYESTTGIRYSIHSDPSAKQVVWTPGGSGTPLRTWIYSTNHDRQQYFSISHATDLVSWTLNTGAPYQFYPTLLVSVEAVTSSATTVQFTVQTRITIEFQGGYSNATLNYSSSAAAAQASTDPLEERIAALESKYNSNPADNNDDFVSVLNELSNPQ